MLVLRDDDDTATMVSFFFFFFFFFLKKRAALFLCSRFQSRVYFLVQQLPLSLSLSLSPVSYLFSSLFFFLECFLVPFFYASSSFGLSSSSFLLWDDDDFEKRTKREVRVLCVVVSRREETTRVNDDFFLRARVLRRLDVRSRSLSVCFVSFVSLSRRDDACFCATFVLPPPSLEGPPHTTHIKIIIIGKKKGRRRRRLKNEIYPKPREREHSRYFLFRFLSRARGGDDRNDRGFDGKHYLLVGWF